MWRNLHHRAAPSARESPRPCSQEDGQKCEVASLLNGRWLDDKVRRGIRLMAGSNGWRCVVRAKTFAEKWRMERTPARAANRSRLLDISLQNITKRATDRSLQSWRFGGEHEAHPLPAGRRRNPDAKAVTDSVPLLAMCVRSARLCRCSTRVNQCRRHLRLPEANVRPVRRFDRNAK